MVVNDILLNVNEYKVLDNKKDSTIIFTHGLAEYSKSYVKIATYFQDNGFNVITYDIRGHGKSFGKRGDISSYKDYIEDLHELVSFAKKQTKNVFLVGHSMGGVITNIYTSIYNNIEGVIIAASPTNYLDRLKTIRFIPKSLINNKKLKTNFNDPKLSSNNDYIKDAYDLDFIYIRVTTEVLIKGIKVLRRNLNKYVTPLLLLYSKNDKLVDYKFGVNFLEEVASKDKELILYNNSNHNIFTDNEKHQIFSDMLKWLNKHL